MMQQLRVNGTTFAVDEAGTGEPVVFIHGALIADAFRPLLSEPSLLGSYRLITYRRRGYEGSSPLLANTRMGEQAADCLALMEHLGFDRAHIVGHSFGGAVALQLALDAPDRVRSLALLEPALILGASAQAYRESLENGIRQYGSQGAAAVVEAMLQARWPDFRDGLEDAMPGALSQAVRDSAASFMYELPALLEWQFDEAKAKRISQSVLSVLGEESGKLSPRFEEVHRWLLNSFQDAEGYELPGAHHFLQIENPSDMASALASFFAAHPLASE